MALRDVLLALRLTYCDRIGVEYTHIQDVEVRAWLQDHMEATRNQPDFSTPERIRILRRIHKAELFERFLHTKYVGFHTKQIFWIVGGLAIVGSVVTFACYITLIGRIGAARAAYIGVMVPIAALAISFFFEKFAWGWLTTAGVALSVMGNVLMLRRSGK